MQKKVTPLGLITLLVWFVLLLPSIAGYIQKSTMTDFYKNYFGIIGLRYGNLLEPLVLTLVFTAAFILYLKAIKACWEWISPGEVLAWTAAFTVSLLFLFPFTCQDVYYYIATGQLQSHYQANPYLTSAHQIAGWSADPFLSTTRWGFLVNVYGPVWTQITHGLTSLAGNHLWLAVLLFKLFAGLVHLLNTVLIGLTAGRMNANPVQAMLVYGWNPLLLFELPGHAHNDALLLTFVILAFYALSRGRDVFAIPFLTLAALVKYTPVLLIPFFGLWLIAKRRLKALMLGCLISLILLLTAWVPYWEGIETLSGLSRQMNFYSIKSLHSLSFQALHAWLPEIPRLVVFEAAAKGLLAMFMLVFIYLLFKLWGNGREANLEALAKFSIAVIIGYLLLANKWFQPWYLAWLIPLAALIKLPHPMAYTALLLSFSAELSRVPQLLMGNTGLYVQLAALGITWFPLLLYRRLKHFCQKT